MTIGAAGPNPRVADIRDVRDLTAPRFSLPQGCLTSERPLATCPPRRPGSTRIMGSELMPNLLWPRSGG